MNRTCTALLAALHSVVPLLITSSVLAAPATEKILGGTHTDLRSSAVAFIFVPSLGTSCTGTLVGPREVLTAAHCIVAPPQEYFVGLGGSSHTVAVAVAAPAYPKEEVPFSFETARYDLGMLVLSEPVTTTSPIPVLYDDPVAVGQHFGVAGYGMNEISDKSDLTVLDLSKVGEIAVVGLAPGLFVSQATQTGTSVCPGDSGGPVLKSGEGYRAISGVTSGGTNKDVESRCEESGDGTSIFVDLQSSSSQEFLSQFPGVTYLSGRLVSIVLTSTKLRTELKSVRKTPSAKAAAVLMVSVKALRSLEKLAQDGTRKRALRNARKRASATLKSRTLTEYRKGVSSVIRSLDSIIKLGVQ